jgi:hypothetical protein
MMTRDELCSHQPENRQRRARGGVSTRTVESIQQHPSVWRPAIWGARGCTGGRYDVKGALRGAAGDAGVSSGSCIAAADGLGDMDTPALNIALMHSVIFCLGPSR